MKILRLRVAGFGPYKSEQSVDFEAFDDDGIFLITGKTGAGKSSILDAICYALYGSVPRYTESKARLRSDHAETDEPSFVELVFRVGTTDYRVRRSPEFERPRLRGTGMTTEKSTAELAVLIGEHWHVTAARPVDVGNDLARLVGLSKEQFLQVILLAQNRFQEFLAASNDERQSVLRSLFGTDRFLAYETFLVDRRRELELQLAGVTDTITHHATQLARVLELDGVPDGAETDDARINEERPAGARAAVPQHPTSAWFEAGLRELAAALARAEATAAETDRVHSVADTELRTAETLLLRQQRRDAAAASLERRLAQPVDSERAAVLAAGRAAAAWSSITARRIAENELLAARALELEARDAYREFGVDGSDADTSGANADDANADGANTSDVNSTPDSAAENNSAVDRPSVERTSVDLAAIDLTAIDEVIDTLTRRVGALEPALADEAELPALASARDTAQAMVAALDDDSTAAADLVAQLPAQIVTAQTALADARVTAAAEEPARESVERITRAADAARDVLRLQVEITAAHRAELASSRAMTAAAGFHQELMDRRFAGHAAELAAGLVDGQPCAVCGSIEHPAPAATDAPPVTSDDIERARAELDACRGALDSASTVVSGLTARLTEAETRSDGRQPDALQEQLHAAESAVIVASGARAQIAAREAEIASLQTTLVELETRLAQAQQRREDASAAVLDADHRLTAATARVAEQRAGFDTVSDRVAALQLHLAAAKALERAIDSVNARQRSLDDATAALTAALVDQGFASETEAESARIDAAELRRLEAVVREHDQAIATARATLAEPELADLPLDPVETDGLRRAVQESREARDSAMSAAGVLRERVRGAEQVVAGAVAKLGASAELRSEYDGVRELANAVQGKEPNTRRMRLETYVLAAQLEQIVAAANVRLRVMTSGRFALEHDDSIQYRNTQSGLGLSILDEHTGRSRATNSLSGGETFLASLALALGLAEVVSNQAGGIRLDTLFIDEGFGSLDPDTLQIAMSTLDGLRAGGRTIGLISHVDSMKEQIPAKLAVSVTPRGDSVISMPDRPPREADAALLVAGA